MALFGEKYGETVRTLTIAPWMRAAQLLRTIKRYSYELCGGTHLERTSDVGAFLITSEGSAAAGIRRIEAVTGRGAYELIARRFKAAKKAAALLSATPEELPVKVESLQDELTEMRRELANLRAELALGLLQFLPGQQTGSERRQPADCRNSRRGQGNPRQTGRQIPRNVPRKRACVSSPPPVKTTWSSWQP